MATIITKTDGMNLTDVNWFYQVVSANLANRGSISPSLTTAVQYINFTASANGNFKWLFLQTYGATYNISRDITCILQENVASVRTTRATQTMSRETFKNGSIWHTLGVYYGKFEFDTGYAIDTTAGKRRIGISQSANWVGTVQLCTSNSTLATSCISVYTDTSVSYTAWDVIIFANNITINSAMDLWFILWSWLTGSGNYSSGATASWKKVTVMAGSAPYTIRLRWMMERCTNDFRECGTSTSRIPKSKLITYIFDSATATSGSRGWRALYMGTSSRYHLWVNTSMYGELAAFPKAKLIAPALATTKVLTLDSNVDWVAWDIVRIGNRNKSWVVESTAYAVASVAGNQVTLNLNLVYDRWIGDEVILLSGRGIKLTTEDEFNTLATNYTSHTLYNPSTNVYDWVDMRNQGNIVGLQASISNTPLMYGKLYNYTWPLNISIQNCSNWNTQATIYYAGNFLFYNCPMYYRNNVCFRACFVYTPYIVNTKDYKAGILYVEDNFFLNLYLPNISAHTWYGTIYNNRNIYANSNANSYYVSGINSIYDGNETYQGTAASAYTYNAINCISKNNTYSTCASVVHAVWGIVINCKELNPTYINNSSPIISYIAWTLFDFTISDPNWAVTSNETTILEATSGSYVAVTNNNLLSTDDIVFTPDGTLKRCGTGLADTTVYWTDSYSLRQETFGTPIAYSINSPMGNKLGKAINVSIYCKINSANYYAGTHVLPKLTVEYDGWLHTVYSQWASTTDWQWLYLSFVPTTDNPEVTISLTSETDATGSDAYVYFWHMEGNIPNISAMNNRAKALPILDIGQLETSAWLVANSVWNYNTALLTWIWTIGNYLKTRLLWILWK